MSDITTRQFPNAVPWVIAATSVVAGGIWFGWQMTPTPDLATATIYVEGKAWEKAVPMLQRVVAADPDDLEAIRSLATCLLNLERFDESAGLLERTPGDQATKADGLIGSGVVHLLGNKRREAERVWKATLALDPEFPGVAESQQKARDKLCSLYLLERRRREFLAVSEAMFDRALPKERFVPLQYRMRSLIRHVEPNAAVKSLQKAAAADPGDFHTRAAIGICLADLERYDEALAEIERCRKHDPQNLFFWEAWCTALERRGDVKGIAEALKSLPPGADASAIAARMQSLVAEQRGEFAAADADLRRAMVLDPDPGDHHRLAQLLMRRKMNDEAKLELELAKSRSPILGEIKDYTDRYQAGIPEHVRQFADWAAEAGTLMERLGRFDDARRWRIAALAADPSYRPAIAALERDAARRYGRD